MCSASATLNSVKYPEYGFDAEERFAFIEGIVSTRLNNENPRLGEEITDHRGKLLGGYHLLDVGGYPGGLADRLTEISGDKKLRCLTIDQPECERDDYVQGSGAEMPFPDDSFWMVVASDTLEHIPPRQRHAFLEECVRVSSRWVVISGPLYSPMIEKAEGMLEGLYEQWTGKPHRWLGEHQEFGLPTAMLISEVLGRRGAIDVLPNAPLLGWTMQMGAVLLAEARNLNPTEITLPFKQSARTHTENKITAYRHAVILNKAATIRDNPKQLFPDYLYKGKSDMMDACEEETLRLVGAQFGWMAELTNAKSAGESASSSTLEHYAGQLEKALKFSQGK